MKKVISSFILLAACFLVAVTLGLVSQKGGCPSVYGAPSGWLVLIFSLMVFIGHLKRGGGLKWLFSIGIVGGVLISILLFIGKQNGDWICPPTSAGLDFCSLSLSTFCLLIVFKGVDIFIDRKTEH